MRNAHFGVVFFGSKFLGSHICIILHGNASPNPLTRSGVLKHVVGSLGTTPSTMKQNSSTRNWGPGSWPWSLCLAHKDSLKRNSVEGSTFLRRKKKWNMLSLMLSLMCYLLLEADFAQHFVNALFDEEGFLKTSKNSRALPWPHVEGGHRDWKTPWPQDFRVRHAGSQALLELGADREDVSLLDPSVSDGRWFSSSLRGGFGKSSEGWWLVPLGKMDVCSKALTAWCNH